MFTGIIQDTGKVDSRIKNGDSVRFTVKPVSNNFLNDVKIGDSISINGACMTIEKKSKDTFKFTTVKESLNKTNLSQLKINDFINLEKAMTLNSKIDGHIVQGHIDATGIVKKINSMKDSYEFFIEFPAKFRDNIIYVGSISINGVSLTIAEILVDKSKSVLIKIAIIPHTYKVTNFHLLKEKDIVNIEFDMMGKYVKRILKK